MIPGTALLAFFNHPAMLGWLVAAAAPLVLHLLNKRKYREVSWAAMQYLLAAVRKNSRRILIEQWLLLAVRTLIVVLVVLAVAEPIADRVGLGFVSREPKHAVLVVDGSYSMGYRPTDQSRFDRARELAARIVDEGSPGDAFTLVLMADPPRVVVAQPAFDAAGMIDEIENLRMPHGAGRLPATLAAVEEVLARARRTHPRLVREEIYFLTDLGRTSWAPDLTDNSAAEYRERIARLARTTAMTIIDLGQEASENLAVSELTTTRPFVTVQGDLEIEATVRNFGTQSRARQLVELFVDGRRSGEQHLDVAPGGTATAIFPYRFDAPGDHAVEVRLAADLLDVDDHRWLSLPVREHLNVLCIEGRPAQGFTPGATDYLTVALAPFDSETSRQPVRVQVARETALLELDLDPFDCIFLADVAQFTSSEAHVLESYLARGGGLVFFLGSQVQPESYNRQLASVDGGGVQVLPARLGEVVAESQYRFDPLDYAHPLVADFRSRDRAGLLTTFISRYYRLEPIDGLRAKVALAFDNGDAAVVEAPIQRGRSILVATSADATWTMMPLWHSYLPIVQELLTHVVRAQLDERNTLVGQSISGSVGGSAGEASLTIQDPREQPRTVRLEHEGPQSQWAFAETWDSGLYRIEPASREPQIYAVNVDTAESDLARLDIRDLTSDAWQGAPLAYHTQWQEPTAQTSDQIVRRAAVHHGLLAAALALLVIESLLAWLFGRRTT